jgi:hypothetical protein
VIPHLQVSPCTPRIAEIEQNVASCFKAVSDILQEGNVVHQILMFDELKVEERPQYDDSTNKIFGVCWEHSMRIGLEFNSENEVQLPLDGIQSREVHLAVEVSVTARYVASQNTHGTN